MPRRGLEVEILRYIIFLFLPLPLSEKRRTKNARPQEKRKEGPSVLFMKTRGPEQVLLRGGGKLPSKEKLKRGPTRKGRKPQE